jgi:hypothetical protein
MKREEIKAIFTDATDEQLKAVMDLNGADVEKAKSKITNLENELKEKKADFDNLNKQLDELKNSNATADEWKAKYEALQSDIDAKEKQAQAEKILAEKNENISKRFESVLGDKKFSHDAIRTAYLKKFGDALESKDFEGKSDADVFHALTKDDASAFVGVTTVKLAGGRPQGTSGKYGSKEDILSIKDGATRRAEMLAHPQFFPELSEK